MKIIRLILSILAIVHSVEVKRNKIVDEFGRERLYHGVNVVYKSAPYIPLTGEQAKEVPRLAFDKSDAELLNRLGQNVIRLAVMWPGVEPQKGVYNMSYIDEVKKIVNTCADHDIDVVFEFHQDGFSEVFCGEGVPYWAAENVGLTKDKTFPWPAEGINSKGWEMKSQDHFAGQYKDYKVPSQEECSKYDWGHYLISYASAKNYKWFYNNKHGLRDKFADYFALLAREFKDYKNVIAFELLNEPSFTWSLYIFPGLTDSHYLQKLYDVVADRIHQEDPNRVILFEPTTWSNEYPDNSLTYQLLRSKLTNAPGGKKQASKSILSYHYYPWVNKQFNSDTPDAYFQSRLKDMKRLGVAGFVTEWNFEGVNTQGDESEKRITKLMSVMDKYQQSWMAWTYKGYLPRNHQTEFVPTCTGCGSGLIQETSDNDYIVNWQTAYTMARTYAQKVQGRIEVMKFISDTNQFLLTYRLDPDIQAPTEIYLNTKLDNEGTVKPRYDLNKINITIQPRGAFDHYFKDSILIIQQKIKLPQNTQVIVRIAPE